MTKELTVNPRIQIKTDVPLRDKLAKRYVQMAVLGSPDDKMLFAQIEDGIKWLEGFAQSCYDRRRSDQKAMTP